MIGFIPILKESCPPILLARPRKYHLFATFASPSQPKKRSSQVSLTACTRPLGCLFQTRLIPLFTLYTSIINSYQPILLHPWHYFRSGIRFPLWHKRPCFGMLVGFLGREFTLGLLSDAQATRIARRRPEGVAKPEYRPPPLLFGSLLLPASLLAYGWTLEQQTMWLPMQLYLSTN